MSRPARFALEEHYALDADAHFAQILRDDELAQAMKNQAAYDGLPAGEAQLGQVFEVTNKQAGLIPLGGWRIEVLEWDDERRVLRSLEADGAVKCWRHPITVEALDVGGCIHRDALEIDASWLTGLHAGFAKRMYAKRHQTRQALRSKSTLQGSA